MIDYEFIAILFLMAISIVYLFYRTDKIENNLRKLSKDVFMFPQKPIGISRLFGFVGPLIEDYGSVQLFKIMVDESYNGDGNEVVDAFYSFSGHPINIGDSITVIKKEGDLFYLCGFESDLDAIREGNMLTTIPDSHPLANFLERENETNNTRYIREAKKRIEKMTTN